MHGDHLDRYLPAPSLDISSQNGIGEHQPLPQAAQINSDAEFRVA